MARVSLSRGMLWAVLAAAIASCDSPGLSPSEVRAACKQDQAAKCCGDDDCAPDEVCDFSVVCGQGSDRKVTCDAPTGDRQCHASCAGGQTCAAGLTCQTKTIYDRADTGDSVALCASP